MRAIYMLIILSILSCCSNPHKSKKKKEKIDGKSNVGNVLIIPDSLLVLTVGRFIEGSNLMHRHQISLIYHLNGNCDACINSLNKFYEELDKSFNDRALNVLIFAHVIELGVFETFIKEIEVKYPIYIDPFDDFYFLSNLSLSDRYEMFLIDSTNSILINADPHDPKESKLFFKTTLAILDEFVRENE